MQDFYCPSFIRRSASHASRTRDLAPHIPHCFATDIGDAHKTCYNRSLLRIFAGIGNGTV